MANPVTTLELIKRSNQAIQASVMGGGTRAVSAPAGKGGTGSSGAGSGVDSMTPAQQSSARSVQSIGQTTAIVIQDAGDMLRNVSTIETTAIGVATAAYVASGGTDETWEKVMTECNKVMTDAAKLYLLIGTNAHAVLTLFN
jgi:hypothetical protein